MIDLRLVFISGLKIIILYETCAVLQLDLFDWQLEVKALDFETSNVTSSV